MVPPGTRPCFSRTHAKARGGVLSVRPLPRARSQTRPRQLTLPAALPLSLSLLLLGRPSPVHSTCSARPPRPVLPPPCDRSGRAKRPTDKSRFFSFLYLLLLLLLPYHFIQLQCKHRSQGGPQGGRLWFSTSGVPGGPKPGQTVAALMFEI